MPPDTGTPRRAIAVALLGGAAACLMNASGASSAGVTPLTHTDSTLTSIPARTDKASNPDLSSGTEAFLFYHEQAEAAKARSAAAPDVAEKIHPAPHRVAPSPEPAHSAAPAPAPSSSPQPVQADGNPQRYALSLVGSAEFACLQPLWERESGWNYQAYNASSGAYGIPQALPGGKMASAGADWQTNPDTQVRWGVSYIDSTYGDACTAWHHDEADGWY